MRPIYTITFYRAAKSMSLFWRHLWIDPPSPGAQQDKQVSPWPRAAVQVHTLREIRCSESTLPSLSSTQELFYSQVGETEPTV